jgi:hypothetical protein
MINSGNKIYIGDTGLAIVCNMRVDTTVAQDAYLQVRKPDGSEVKWPAEPHGVDGEHTYLKYVTQEGDLDMRGRYKVQPVLTLSTWTGRGETDEFRVEGRYR